MKTQTIPGIIFLIAGFTFITLTNACNTKPDQGTVSDIYNGNDITNNTAEADPDIVRDIDGNVYKTFRLGEQVWMAEDLRVSRYNNGEIIPTGLSAAEWGATTKGAYAIYDNDTNMLSAYGKLYNWHAVNDPRGLCPEGWHVPGDPEWLELISNAMALWSTHEYGWDYPYLAADVLKSCRQVGSPLDDGCNTSDHPRWNHDDQSEINYPRLDEPGFNALPGGIRYTDGEYYYVGECGLFWSSEEYSPSGAWFRFMVYYSDEIYKSFGMKSNGLSVRCVRATAN